LSNILLGHKHLYPPSQKPVKSKTQRGEYRHGQINIEAGMQKSGSGKLRKPDGCAEITLPVKPALR